MFHKLYMVRNFNTLLDYSFKSHQILDKKCLLLNCCLVLTLALMIRKKKNNNFPIFFTFFYIQKKKVLDMRKFSTSSLRWIYMFWDVLNTIGPFLENVCLSVCLYYFVDTVSQELMGRNGWNLIFSCTFMGLRAD